MAWSDIVTAPPPQAPGPKPSPEQLANLPSAVGYASPQLPPAGNPLPILKQVLETPVPGVPPLWQSQPANTPNAWNPAPIVGQVLRTQVPVLPIPPEKALETKKEITPESLGQKQVPEADKAGSDTKTVTPESLGQKQVPEAEQKPETTAVTPESLGQKQVPEAEPQPQPQQPETPMPSGTGEGAPQGLPGPLVPGREAHINALIASGKPPGEAQAIADGQELKTVTGETPQPKPTPEPKTEQKPTPTLSPEDQAQAKELAQNEFNLPPEKRHPEWLGPNARAEYDKLVAGTSQPSEPPTAATTTTEEPPKVVEGNKIQGTSTVFGLNYDRTIDPDDNGIGFFGGINTRNPNLKAVAVPVDVLEGIFGKFTQKNAQGGYDALDTPEAKAIIAKIRSAHVEVPDADGKIHKFPIVDIQGSLKGHPGKVLDFTWGATHEMGFTDNHAISYQIIGGDGKPYPIPDIEFATADGKRGDGHRRTTAATTPTTTNTFAGQPMVSIPSAGGTPQLSGGGPRGGGWSGDSGYGGGSEATPRTADTSPINLTSLLEAAAGGAAAGSLFRGGGGQPPAQRPTEEEPPPPPPSGGIKPANVLGVRTISAGPPPPAPSSLQAQLLPPPAAPTAPAPSAAPQPTMAPIKGPDPAVVKALMKRGFTRQQAEAFAAKATVSKPGTAAITGGASKPVTQPSGAPPAKQPPPAPAPPAKQAPLPAKTTPPAAPPAKPAALPPESEEATSIGPRGSTIGVARPQGSEALEGVPFAQALKQHATLLSPDDPRVKKQADGMFKGEHFVPGDPVHDPALEGLPGGHGGRQRQILGEAEQAIAEKRPLHVSYISAPKEAEKFPTRESRRIQYDEHSPEARLMGTTEGQLVGHSMIPVSVGISPSRKTGEPHQSYIQGISTNILANNFQHVNDKLAAIGRKTPYQQLGQKFFNDLEGYYANLNAGHTATGRGHVLGTEDHPSEPDRSHVPYKLSRSEADFIGTVLNNTAAFAKHSDAEKLRELARVNGTLITPEGETNRLRHEIEQHEPGWRQRVLEPSIRSFKTGLVHEVHPDEEHMPATIRPGKEYQQLTKALARTSERGRPDVPVAASLHHTFADNKAINQIERDFSQERITEEEARARLRALGEDPDQFQFIGGSGGLITPYEENPEAITPEEHTELKSNLRKQWIGGKMPIEDYRRKAAEVPLPEKPSQPPASSPAASETETVPSPKPITPVKPKPPKPQPKPEPEPVEAEETPETPLPAPKPAAPTPKPKPAPKAPQEDPEAPKGPPAPDEPLPPSASHYVSPNVKEGTDLAGALKQVQSQPHKKARDFYQKVEDAYRPEGGGTVTPTVGNWEGTAEGSSWTHDDKDSLQDARTKAALKGLHSAQKGTAVFHYDEAGPDRHYDIDFPEHSHEEADKLITKHGFPASTIHKTPEGLRAHLIDPGGENYEHALELAAEAKAKSPIARRGTAAFDGGDDRPAAAEAYRRILGESGIQIRGSQGGIQLRGHGAKRQHPLQPSYEEAEDNYERLARELGQKGEAPVSAVGPPPAPGDILPPAKPKKAAKSKEQAELEAEDMRQAAIDRDNISPEDQAGMNRLNKKSKAWIKQNPDVDELSMHAHLTGKRTFPGKLKNEQIGEYYDANNPKLDYGNDEHRERVSHAVVHDIMHSLAGTTTGGKPSTAYGWYDRTVRKSLNKAAEIAPQILTDPDHSLAWKLAWAITSQGQDVFPNTESTWHAYRHWVKTGKLPESREIFGGGQKAQQMEENFKKVNKLWHGDENEKGLGHEGLQKLLMKRMTVGQLEKKFGLKVPGELKDHVVNGAMSLGAKIGAFFSNVNGDFDPTTMDLWFSRNMNLMAGNMFGFSDEATRKDRMEKGKLVRSHLGELKDALDSGMLSIDQGRAKKMSDELGALMAHPEGQLDRPTAKALAPEIYNWAREQHGIYQKSSGLEGSYHEDLKTPVNLTAKKIDENATKLSDAPRHGTERSWWRDIMHRAGDKLKAAGVRLTNADKQALLWFNIKDLFRLAGSPQRDKADYLDATYRLVRKVESGQLPGLEQTSGQPRVSGGVLHMDTGGLVPQPSEVPGPMTLGATNQQSSSPLLRQPSSPLLGQTTAPAAPDLTPAPRAQPVQTPAPRALPAQTPAVTTGPANYTALGQNMSGLATNFGHDLNGNPDQYMLKTLGPGSRIGAFGADVTNPQTAGVSLPIKTIQDNIGNYQKNAQIRTDIANGRYQVVVNAPNGKSGMFRIVDVGPGPNESGKIDITGNAMKQLGVTGNFNANFQIVDTATGQAKSVRGYQEGGLVTA